MRNRKLQGFASPARKKISTLPPPSHNPPGSIFFRQPLHLSIRSRAIASCLNILSKSTFPAGAEVTSVRILRLLQDSKRNVEVTSTTVSSLHEREIQNP